jgi:hypothetical protein
MKVVDPASIAESASPERPLHSCGLVAAILQYAGGMAWRS